VEFGWPIGMPFVKAVGNGIYEVRTLISKRIARVPFDIDKKGRMVLLHGFIKKTQKTPEEELELASNNKNKHQRALQVKGMKMKRRRNHKVTNHDGSTFDGFLEEQGIREEAEAVAIKRVLAWQLERAMQEQQKTKQSMAKQLRTPRSQLDRPLDPQNTSVTLHTIARVAGALGIRQCFEMLPSGSITISKRLVTSSL
jgi:antitoxin HicB